MLRFKPKYDKILELLLYLAHRRPGADHYQAVKFLYLADRAHLNAYGRPITYERYCALPYGPVASSALALLKNSEGELARFGINALPFRLEKLDRVVYIREPLREVDYERFSKSDLKIFDAVLEEHGRKNFGELHDLTHAHFAYANAWNKRPVGKKSVLMRYEDMLDESSIKAEYIADIEPVAEHMQ